MKIQKRSVALVLGTVLAVSAGALFAQASGPVSYTHLTLPTIYSV